MAAPFLAALNLLASPFISLEESLISKGSNRGYSYEVWNTEDTTGYYLKVCKRDEYPNREAPQVIGSFNSSKEALDYLERNFT